MLLHLHVKNLALIDEAEVDFTEGLNILTGETGAGKSILIGSINLALGQKASKSMIREHAEYAFVELVFEAGERTAEKLKQMDIFPDDGQVIISRKLTGNRSICKINGETCTVSMVKQASFICLIFMDSMTPVFIISGKAEEILDAYGKEEIQEKREQVQKDYETYKALRKELEQYEIDEEQKNGRWIFWHLKFQKLKMQN